ncbi:hypothetical protein EH230_10940 [Flavobacterium columnare]|uniref:DUF7738 domain-containing protein n=1 Tax=Flavobacterium columnare TaxID=996 RepID=A0A437UCP8_9FLAO|nr:hypothetical protein [Flavobacterium columnare]RVU91371.1 hypothetical protein EH230_10940 [Flavobacterium columnare]
MKIKSFFNIIILTFLNVSCQMKQDNGIDLEKATIKVDSCGIYYKGKRLDLGDSVSQWEKVLGKPDRTTDQGYTWDKLGISVSDWEIGENIVDAIYIYFVNLDSPDGKAGLLSKAKEWKQSTDEEIKESEKWAEEMKKLPEYKKEEDFQIIRRQVDELYKKNYVYPFTTYQGIVNLHGSPLKAGMKIKEINENREKLSFSDRFGYVDQDIDGVNDSHNTTDTFGGDYRAPGCECKEGRLQYYELTFTSNGTLEFLKIAREEKENYEFRKVYKK